MKYFDALFSKLPSGVTAKWKSPFETTLHHLKI